MTDITSQDVFRQYAKYLVEDFTNKTHSLMAGSYPLDDKYKQEFINFKVDELLGDISQISNPPINTVTRFINECSEYALENYEDKAMSREIWDKVSLLPSLHHEELQAILYASASLYDTTINDVLVGTVMRDAKDVAGGIRIAVESFMNEDPTGGRVNVFDWGLLNNGLWLNGALMKAYELSNTFRPGDQIVADYARVCYDFAYSRAEYTNAPREELDNISGYLFQALSIAGEDVTAEYNALETKFNFVKALAYSSELVSYIKYWQRGFSETNVTIDAIATMSSVISVLNAIKEVCRTNHEELLIPESIGNRINTMIDVITLALVAYEALRETQFSDTLIFTATKREDGTIDVFVNADLLRAYESTGGDERDLIYLGLYIVENSSIVTPRTGWTLSWANSRKDDVMSEMIAKESFRREELDRGQRHNIKQTVFNKVFDVAQSYYEVANKDTTSLSPVIVRQIDDISRGFNQQDATPIEQSIYDLLLHVGNQDHVTSMGTKLINYMSSDNQEAKQNAKTLTFIDTAVEDFANLIFA